MTKTLLDLQQGEEVTIRGLNPDIEVDLRRYLLGMGLVKGAKIKKEKIAPLGDPIIFKLKDYLICLRKEEAKQIEVE